MRHWGQSCLWCGRRSAPTASRGAAATAQSTQSPWASCGKRGRRAAFRVAGAVHRPSPFVWQAQYTEHPQELRRCVGASKQSLRGQLWRAWAPLGPQLPFDGRRSTQSSSRRCWQAQSQSLLAEFAAHVGVAGRRLPFGRRSTHHNTTEYTTYDIPTNHCSKLITHASHLLCSPQAKKTRKHFSNGMIKGISCFCRENLFKTKRAERVSMLHLLKHS